MKNSPLSLALVVVVSVALSVVAVMLFSSPNQPSQSFGSLAGPDIASPYLNWGNVPQYNSGVDISATSSVLCTIQNPAGATSTINRAGIRFDTNVFGAINVDISTTSNSVGYGSSTPALVAFAAIPSGVAPGYAIAWMPQNATSSNPGAILSGNTIDGTSLFLLGPNDFVSFRVATRTPGTFGTYSTGKCTLQVTRL